MNIKRLPVLLITIWLCACQGTTTTPQATISSEDYFTPAPTPVPAIAFETQSPTSGATTPAGCTATSPKPTTGPTEASLFPPVSDKDWVLGSDQASITIIEYGDFQCPYCANVAPVLERALENYSDQIRLVYRHFPLISIHDKAALGVQAAEAAGRQGKFWEMHDLLFAEQSQWAPLPVEDFVPWLESKTSELGLDKETFRQDLESPEIVQLAKKAWDDNRTLGIPYTPFVLIDDQIWADRLPLDDTNLSSVIELNLLTDHQFTSCPPVTVDTGHTYTATIHTEKGNIQLELFTREAPLAVNNFIFLAQNGWYDNITFHRVIAGYIAQAGDPSGTGYGTPGYAFVNEISPKLRFDKAGILGMANAGPDTNGSQFFITMNPAPQLDGKYTIFGQVTSGMEVVESLTPRDTAVNPNLPPGDKIISIEIGN
jgi:cyclophilin family peptidyl-prolyl cis-trans isomerase/protein-disulfide isomerase